jgi:hypothetical protein
MQQYHNHPTAGHPGRDETTRLVTKEYWWPNIQAYIQQYVQGCGTCQQNKNLTHPQQIPMYKIPMTCNPRPFSQITMDLITDLPKSHGFDSILTIVDHGTSRTALFLPCNKTITRAGITKLYYEHVYRWFGTPT